MPRPCNEPAYASFAYLTDDETQVTFMNVFSDPEAMADHFALVGEIDGLARLMGTIEITGRQVYGDLTPALVEKVTGADGTMDGALSGTFDRQVIVGAKAAASAR